MLNNLSLLIILIPLIFVYIPSIFYNTKNIGSNISFRPPPIVFALVWPILLILVGISWYLHRDINMMINIAYITLCILLGLWIILYKYSKLAGLIDIIACLLLCLFLILYKLNVKKLSNISSYLLIPLVLWLSFASILNITDIYNS